MVLHYELTQLLYWCSGLVVFHKCMLFDAINTVMNLELSFLFKLQKILSLLFFFHISLLKEHVWKELQMQPAGITIYTD